MTPCKPQWSGARALGVEIAWRFEFVGHGSLLDPEPDVITLDVGNAFGPGMLDQHHDLDLGLSTAELVFKHPELVYEHLAEGLIAASSSETHSAYRPVIRTHWSPDFDAVASAVLVQEFIAHGRFPAWAFSLVDIASSVDSGAWLPEISQGLESPALKSVMLMMHAIEAADDGARMTRAMAYLRAEADSLGAKLSSPSGADDDEARFAPQGGRSVWEGPLCGGWAKGDPHAEAILERLRSDISRYHALSLQVKRSVVSGIGSRDGESKGLSVPCAIVSPESVIGAHAPVRLLKYWLRADGAVMTIIPLPYAKAPGRHRAIIALDPTYRAPSGHRPSLMGLGRALEEAEQARRLAIGDPALIRTGTPRYDWVDHDDPWYTGVGHDYTIVDSPRSGSVLEHEAIAHLAVTPSVWAARG
jgi:hypothetical protein